MTTPTDAEQAGDRTELTLNAETLDDLDAEAKAAEAIAGGKEVSHVRQGC